MRRREVLKLAALSTMGSAMNPLSYGAPGEDRTEPTPIIDAHIHLFDPRRPGGVPWPEKTDAVLYKPSLPERYTRESARFGIVGAIAVECSPLASDNQWLIDVAAKNPIMVGVIGDLVPGAANYARDLNRLHQSPLFLGFRYGNLWDRDLYSDIDKPRFVDGLKTLAASGLVLESANPDPRLISAICKVQDRVPELRIVIDHLPHLAVPSEAAARDAYWADLHALAQNPRVFVKLSEIPVRADGRVVTDPHSYQGPLDAIWSVFGEDHILFGSDWPNSDHVATYAETFQIVRNYVAGKSPEAREKFFWKNSIAAYRWKRRRPDQPVA
jgi:predicted TIM-barrel fold metal-dependent hydrolase